MIHAIKCIRSQQPPSSFSSLTRIASPARFRSASSQTGCPDKVESSQKDQKAGDVAANSFGEGYATRSDEEGFGGTRQGSTSVNNIQYDREINEKNFDKNQGCDVAEKEKGRNQPKASS